MLRREQLLSEMHLRNLEIVNNLPSGRKTNRPPNSNRTLMKLYLTRQILEECLETLDIFKEILEDPVQKSKLVRDVGKNIRLKVYDEDAVVYSRGDLSLEFYLLVKGEVSLRMPVYKQVGDEGKTVMSEQEIDTVKEGTGFGEAEFIHGKKRSLIAKAQINDTVIGVIEGSAFEQIIQSYKQRVYYKKMQMFSKCPLLNSIHPTQLQFIVNNAKPIVIPISKQIVKQGQVARSLYLITDGKVEMRKQPKRERLLTNFSKYRLIFNERAQDCVEEKIKIKNIVIAVIGQGEFIGDRELAMGQRFGFSAVAQTEKVRAYVCDERIILSQISKENLQLANFHYHRKQLYREEKSQIYNIVKNKLQKKLKTSQRVILSEKQKELKKMIINRYVEETPSIIGRMSPRDINKSIDVKYLRLKTEPRNKIASSQIPTLSVLPPVKVLKADKRAYSPLLKEHLKHQDKASNEQTKHLRRSISCHHQYEVETMPQSSKTVQRMHSKPLLVFMKPFTKKVQSLHQRLTRNYNYFTNQNNKASGKSSRNTLESYSIIQMKRVKEYLSRSKSKRSVRQNE